MASCAPLPLDLDAPLPARAVLRQPTLTARSWQELDTPATMARWDALAARAEEPNPFFESWFLLPALQALDPRGRTRVLCLETDGVLTGLLPVRLEGKYYGRPLPHWGGWLHPNAFLGAPLVAPGCERAFWRALLAWCDEHVGAALFLHLSQLPSTGPLHEALYAVLADEARLAATVMREDRAMLQSQLSPDDYLEQSLSGKKRKELRRQHRRLEEEGALEIERIVSTEGLTAWIAEFLALERRGWKGLAGSALACDDATAALFRKALAGAAERGRLERLSIRLDGRPLAMLASFLTPPGAFSFKTAFDEDFARFSPGVLLQRENLALLARPDIVWVDSCAAADHPMIDHFWRERRTMARHSIAIGGPLRRRAFAWLSARETGHPAGNIS